MRRIIVAEFMSLDGFIAQEDDKMDFFQSINDKELYEEMMNSQKEWDTLLLGRRTFEMMSVFWSNSPSKNEPITKYMNSVPKVVISTKLTTAKWADSKVEIVEDHPIEKIKELKNAEGKSIAVLGSATLFKYLLKARLVDEISLLIYPIVIGKGIGLFHGLETNIPLKLIEQRTFSKSGIIKCRYEI